MINIWNKQKGMILCLAGVYVEESKNCFDPKMELYGVIATTGERMLLGSYEREHLEGIFDSIAKSHRVENSIYVLK